MYREKTPPRALFAVVLAAAAGPAGAEPFVDSMFAVNDVAFESDRYLIHTAWTSSRNSIRTVAHDESHTGPFPYFMLAQGQQPPTDDSVLPTLPAPTNAGIPPPMNETGEPVEAAAGEAAEEKPTTEMEKEFKKIQDEDKKEEEKKPVIPDLAKGILIATNDGDLTFKPGVRIQPRYMYDSGNSNNDFFIRRFRLKGAGSAYGVAKYGVELKIDNEGRFAVSPTARVENAWLDFPVADDQAFLRAGLYDIPFSRNALTSDSKLLFMDRTLIKEQLTAVGMADNTIGLMLHGRPYCGQFEYAFGIFDNDQFERFGLAGTKESDQLMPAGRVVWNVLDPMKPPEGYADYYESYLGKGQRLELGANAAPPRQRGRWRRNPGPDRVGRRSLRQLGPLYVSNGVRRDHRKHRRRGRYLRRRLVCPVRLLVRPKRPVRRIRRPPRRAQSAGGRHATVDTRGLQLLHSRAQPQDSNRLLLPQRHRPAGPAAGRPRTVRRGRVRGPTAIGFLAKGWP